MLIIVLGEDPDLVDDAVVKLKQGGEMAMGVCTVHGLRATIRDHKGLAIQVRILGGTREKERQFVLNFEPGPCVCDLVKKQGRC